MLYMIPVREKFIQLRDSMAAPSGHCTAKAFKIEKGHDEGKMESALGVASVGIGSLIVRLTIGLTMMLGIIW